MKDILAKSTPEDTSDAQVAEIKAAKDKLMESARRYGKSPYGEHLKRVAEGRLQY